MIEIVLSILGIVIAILSFAFTIYRTRRKGPKIVFQKTVYTDLIVNYVIQQQQIKYRGPDDPNLEMNIFYQRVEKEHGLSPDELLFCYGTILNLGDTITNLEITDVTQPSEGETEAIYYGVFPSIEGSSIFSRGYKGGSITSNSSSGFLMLLERSSNIIQSYIANPEDEHLKLNFTFIDKNGNLQKDYTFIKIEIRSLDEQLNAK